MRRTVIDNIMQRLLRGGIGYANKRTENFRTYHERPKFDRQIGAWAEHAVERAPAAIVMQGPIATDDDFTLETLKLYAKRMPDCRLILSTWKETPRAQLDPIEELGVELVLSERPAKPGLFNINMQLVSASAGVQRAVEGGAAWVMKTRTDQRLYKPNFLEMLIGLARTFPAAEGYAQKHRIIGVGHGSLKYAPYHVTDQTVFGHADDMLAYWTPPLRETATPAHWPSALRDVYLKVPIGELCRLGAAESYFASQFLVRLGRPLDWTLEDTWAAYRDHFCFVDYATTDFFWVKSQTFSLREFPTRYDDVTNRYEIGFGEWLLLHTGQLPPAAARRYEGALDTFFEAPIVPAEGG